MKLFIGLLLLLIPTLNYGYKKNELPYPIAILKADLIVDGTITKVSKNEYEFAITQFVKGKSDSKIKVSIWKEWLCDPRIKELKTGQRLILLLEKTTHNNFATINNSTGELYIDNNSFINIFLPKDFSTPEIFKKGILMFIETYKFYGDSNDKFFQNVYFECNKSIFEIYLMKQNNSTFNFLVNYTNYFKIKEIHPVFQIKNLQIFG
ncbi:hypothetical protein [Flavobacterium lipolyticum]|uniref:DUF4369 domain-containing protein n=1 Tax=Flavobacterium lipolyticum TaxID=2893754 RepID=A0ABS8M5M8_9FLAO|nr:hypothetical protein [Flavobacterium sp. F-126]MCC9019999.1 hypothetical protein [Flavobacterium sp. F-126]